MVERVTTLAGVHAVLPPHRYTQAELTAAFTDMCLGPDGDQALLARLHANAQVSSRHLVLPLEQYATLTGFGESNDLFIAHAVQLGAAALTGALQRAGIAPDEVDVVISTTITGIAVPSIEARIAQLVGLRPDVKRMPLFGLGCVAGAAGIARLHDYLIGHPNQVGALLSVELCSLTHFRQGAFLRSCTRKALPNRQRHPWFNEETSSPCRGIHERPTMPGRSRSGLAARCSPARCPARS